MVKFFLPLTFVLIIAWLIVGLEQERQKNIKEIDFKIENVLTLYDSLLSTDTYKDYELINNDDLYFLMPKTYYKRSDLTNEPNAIMQFSDSTSDFFMVLYKDTRTLDSLAFNYSKKTYAISTILGARQQGEVVVMDSSDYNNINALKVSFRLIRTLKDFNKDTFYISFLSFENQKDVYMLYFYSKFDFFEPKRTEVDNIMSSINLLNE